SELEFLVSYDKTKKAMQEIVDMPDQKLDLFIKSVLENNGILSAKKRNRYPELTAEEIDGLAQVVNAMMHKPK
ncbi:MAG TPA: cell filamentation protein Fic, partial [Gammaproteobacteria bacterium]|nr:cell filamentation protein Fic [Gammaproteobacteria bacterium]